MTMTLRRARKKRKLSMYRLALRAGVTEGTISRLENGGIKNPRFDTIEKLEQALRLRRGTLIFRPAA
jgi:transcriptional regulator with XRE-family HTH domain